MCDRRRLAVDTSMGHHAHSACLLVVHARRRGLSTYPYSKPKLHELDFRRTCKDIQRAHTDEMYSIVQGPPWLTTRTQELNATAETLHVSQKTISLLFRGLGGLGSMSLSRCVPCRFHRGFRRAHIDQRRSLRPAFF